MPVESDRAPSIESIDQLQTALREELYIAERGLSTSIYLALKLGKPLFLEGEAGVGKTEVAKAIASVLGTELIRLAVCTANARGCDTFLAHVQMQNVPLFRRLKWNILEEVELHGVSHARMSADLDYYHPPCEDPKAGWFMKPGRRA